MEVYVKESLYVLDYNDNKTDAIFLSDDHITPGYAYSINIEESNTGYSNLTFSMPNTIINENQDKIKNPKLKLLTPLVKLRYERQVTYTGKEIINVQEPYGYGDTTTYINKQYNPGDTIEDYIMDFIVQPVEKKRNVLEIATNFTAIDYPRFNLSKKKFGLTINDDTVTRADWSLYKREPMDVAGTVKYLKWDSSYAKYGTTYSWDPEKATEMPLLNNQINHLLEDTDLFSYGVTATVFWWPIVSTGRYNGILYEEGDYLTLSFYNTNITITDSNVITIGEDVKVFTKYTWLGSKDSGTDGWSITPNLTDADWLAYAQPSTDALYLGSYSDAGSMPTDLGTKDENKWCLLVTDRSTNLAFYGYNWGTLDQGDWYLTPNNACNYLQYALENTNWEIKNSSDRYVNTFYTTGDFPSSLESEDSNPKYLIYKVIYNTDKYIGQNYSSVASLPTLTSNDVGTWTLVYTKNGDIIVNTLKWVWNGSQWNYDYDDKDELTTKIYAWYNDTSSITGKEIIGHWVNITDDAWASSIDKKTGVLYDVDAVETEVAKPDGASGAIFETTELHSSLSASESNSYNIITSVCKEFQLYPIFDCINRTVSLKLFSGKNYGLTYQLGGALDSSSVKEDGEKVITKLRCFGGNDEQSSEAINLGEAQRKCVQYLAGFYTAVDDLPSTGWWAVVDPDLKEDTPWISGENRKVYFRNSGWVEGIDNGDGTWTGIAQGTEYTVDAESGMAAPWDPNDAQYIQSRSPYGTEYIYNFKWMYDNDWMTKEQILGLYKVNDKIQELNTPFLDTYYDDLTKASANYVNEGVNYKTNQDVYTEVINNMANDYYYKPDQPNAGSFHAFPYVPGGCTEEIDTSTGKSRYYVMIYHCSSCGKYTSTTKFTKCPICNLSSNIVERKVRIPVFNDADYSDTQANQLKPATKGNYQTLLEWLGNNEANRNAISVAKKFETRLYDNLSNEVQFNVNGTWKDDTSENLYEWNYDIDKWIEYYGYMIDSQRKMVEAGKICDQLAQEKHEYDVKMAELENQVQDGWGDYIVEGKYKDEEIVYPGILLNKSLEASDEYATPKVTYSLNVIDSSGFVEYRNHCDDVYNDLVYTLQNVGQIIPKAGDYCKIYDEPMGLYGVPGLITTIKRVLDDPKSNSITIDTAYTDSDELVGNIINATNTVLNNSDIYARTAVLNGDGTIATASLTESLQNSSSDNITFIGVNGSSVLDSSGLIVTDPTNPLKKMKYVGNGIYGTTDNASTWTSMITPEGINASYIKAGSINTQNVQINSGLYNKVVLDQFGLSVKTDASSSYSFPTGTKKYGDETVPDWSTTNLSAFLGVNRNNEALLYVKGQLVADKGSQIGGWYIGQSDLYNAVTNPTYILSPGGVSRTNIYDSTKGNTNYNLYINGKFGVTTDGILHAKGIEVQGNFSGTGSGSFSGTISCNTSSTINGSLGQVEADSVTLSANGISGTVNGHSDSWAIYSKGNFGVTTGGNLYATNANISGTISTTNLSASGTVTINDAKINSATLESCSISAGQITSGTFESARIPSLSASKITSGTVNATTVVFKTGDGGYLEVGTNTTHPKVSALNCESVIDFGASNGVYINGNAGEVGPADTDDSVTISGNKGIFLNGDVTVSNYNIAASSYSTWYNGTSREGGTETVEYLPGLSLNPKHLVFCNGLFISTVE